MMKCIAFDLDGTLYDEKTYVEECYRAIANLAGPKKQDEIFEYMMWVRAEEGDSEVFQNMMKRFGIPKERLSEFIAVYHEYPADLSLLNDAKEFLSEKKHAEYYALLTNGGYATQRNKCKLLNIHLWMDSVIITGKTLEKKYWKPDRRAFALISSHTGCRASECLYVGDSYEKDVQGALEAGMHACLVDRRSAVPCEKVSGFYIVNSLTRLGKVMEDLRWKNVF